MQLYFHKVYVKIALRKLSERIRIFPYYIIKIL